MKHVMLMIGTRKGAFLAFAPLDRKKWELTGPILKGAQVNHVTWLEDAGPTVVVANKSEWWGPDVRLSRDFGETWLEPPRNVRFAEGRGLSVDRV